MPPKASPEQTERRTESAQLARIGAIMDVIKDLSPASIPALFALLTNPENTKTELTVLRGALMKVDDWRATAIVNAVGLSKASPTQPINGATDLTESVTVRLSAFDLNAATQISSHYGFELTNSDAIRYALTFTAMMLNAAFEDGLLKHV